MKGKFVLPVILMIVLALSRWPDLMPSNFSAVYAMAFCGGLYFSNRFIWVPVVTVVASDVALNILHFQVEALSVWMLPNYLAYAAIFLLGRKFNPKTSWIGLASGGLLGAVCFYLITNTASWLQLSYSKTLAGWIQALTTGLPNYPHTWEFFRNTLLSGGFFTGLFVGAMKLTESPVEKGEAVEESPDSAPEPESADA